MGKNTIEVNILGSTFSIQSDNDPLYLEEVVAYLKDRIDQVKKDYTIQDSLKISLMASLNLVDELFRILLRSNRLQNR
jgi:cell division protein ZapA